jgi:hypothetical protein
MDYLAFNPQAAEIRQATRQAAEREIRVEGTTDAAFGDSPSTTDPSYLDEFFKEMRRRVEAGEHLEIRWLSESFRYGAYDAPDNDFTGEW